MGYNLSKSSVIRSKPDLELLYKAKKTVKFPTPRPDQKVRRLREAIAAAEVHEEFRYLYEGIYGQYRFKLEPGYLVAIYQGGESTGIIVEDPNDGDIGEYENMKNSGDGAKANGNGEEEGKRLIIETAFNLIEVLGSILANLDSQELTFPNAVLDESEKIKIYGWTRESEHCEWNLIDSGDKGITLTKDKVPHEITFMPPGEES